MMASAVARGAARMDEAAALHAALADLQKANTELEERINALIRPGETQ